MTKKRIIFIIVFVCCLVLGYFLYGKYSNEGILEKVMDRDGYALNLIKERETVEFYIKPEWIPFNSTDEIKEKTELTTKHDTNIILDTVWNRGEDIYFNFDTTYNLNNHKGRFMYNCILNEDGSVTRISSNNEYEVYNNNDEKIDIGQSGDGPNSAFGFAIESQNYDLIKDGFYIKYSGFYLYEYEKN